MRTRYIESNKEEDIITKHFRVESLPDPISMREGASKLYVDKKFNNPSIMKNTAHVEFNDKNLENVRFDKENSVRAVGEILTPKYHVDEAYSSSVDESTLVNENQDNDFKFIP